MDNNTKCAKRLLALFDEGTFSEIGAQVKSGDGDAEVVTGYGYVGGAPAYAFSQNREINGGAMGTVQAQKIGKIYDLAGKTGLPVIGIFDSEGAYIEEGLSALAAYGDLILKANNLSGVVPQIAVIAGSCIGLSAVLAASADVVIASKESKLCVSPDNTDAAANGTVQITADDDIAAVEEAERVFSMLPLNNLAAVPGAEATEPECEKECKCVCGKVVDGAGKIKLSPDFGKAVKTVFARIMGVTCGIVNYNAADGIITSDDCVKAARFVRMCDSFSVPVISFVNAERFSDKKADEVRDAALLAHAYSEATTIKISVITGKASGAVFTVLAGHGCGADMVFALDTAKISVLSPEAAAMVLMSGRRAKGESLEKLAKEYEAENCSPEKAAAGGFIDEIVTESALRGRLYTALEMLAGKRVSGLDKKHSNMPL